MDRLEDGRTRGFWWAPNDLVDDGHLADMGPHAAAVYIVLLRYSDRDRQAWPKVETIERLTGISRAAVFRALKLLESRGYVSRWRDGKRNVYQILQIPAVKQVSERDVSEGHVSDRDPTGLREIPNGSQRDTRSAHDSARAGRDKSAQKSARKKHKEKDLRIKNEEEEEVRGDAHLSNETPTGDQAFRAVFSRPEAMADRLLHDALRGAPEPRARMLAALVEVGAWPALRGLRREARSARAWHEWLDQLSRVLAGRSDAGERVARALERLALAPDVRSPFTWIISVVSGEQRSNRQNSRQNSAADGVDVDMRGVYIEEG